MKKDHLVEVGLDGKIISNWVLKQSFGRAWTWVGQVQDRVKYWAVVEVVMNIRVL